MYHAALHPSDCLLTLNDSYPREPNPGGKTPDNAPRDGDGNPLFADDTPSDATSEVYEDGNDSVSALKKPYKFPGCPDKWGGLGSAIALQQFLPVTEPTCDANKASEVPYNIFSNSSGNIYDKFCAALTPQQHSWIASPNGLDVDFRPIRKQSSEPVRSQN